MDTPFFSNEQLTSVDKSLLLVREVVRKSEPVSVSWLSAQTGVPKSTAHRLLLSLSQRDIISKVGVRYTPGRHLEDLAAHATGRNREMRNVLVPYLVELYERIQGGVSLAVLHGLHVDHIENIYDRALAPLMKDRLGYAPAHRTATGKALLAYRSDLISALSSDSSDADTAVDDATLIMLQQELQLTRHRGLSYETDDYFPGIVSVAAPLFDVGPNPVASIGVSGSTGRLDLRAAAAAVQNTSEAASSNLRRARDGRLWRGES